MKYFVTVLLLCLVTTHSPAQITVTYNNMISGMNQASTPQDSYIDSTQLSGLVPLIAQAGASQSWDFTHQPWVKNNSSSTATTTILTYPGGAAAADDPDFTAATHVMKIVYTDPTIPISYQFVKLDQTGYWALGMSQDSFGVKKKLFSYTPPYQSLKLPCTYQTTWQSTSNFNIGIPIQDYTITESQDAIVDGYGTLITPTSAHKHSQSPMASNEVLRIKNKITQKVTYMGNVLSTIIKYTYQWFSTSKYNALITTDEAQAPLTANYSSGTSSSVSDGYGLDDEQLNPHLSSNPASNSETKLYFTMKQSGNAEIRIMDQLGREVHILHNGQADAGQNIIPIDPSKLSSGTYFIRVNADGMMATRKLIITK